MSLEKQEQSNLAVFWDYASTHPSSASSTMSNYNLVANIRSACLEFGPIKAFRAYGHFSGSSRPASIRSELSSSGVTLIDCPDDGKTNAGVKTMLVDIIAHAWDHPDAHTYVILSNDRDVGYAVGTLRMRKFQVIVISSVAAHADLTAHASKKLDWSKTVLGLPNGFTQSTNFADFKPPSSQLPTSSPFPFRQQDSNGEAGSHHRRTSFTSFQKPVEQTYPELVELHDLPPPRGRPRSHSVFSAYDPRKFDGFGALSDLPMTPKTQPAFSGLGDGPLFPHPRPLGEERVRAESVPPHVAYSSNLSRSVFPPFSEDEGSPPSAWKGKNRDTPGYEPESVMPRTANIYAGSIFEPFSEAIMHFQESSTIPPVVQKEQMIQDILTSSTSPSSQSSKFSIVQHSDTTALTSAATVTDKNVAAVEGNGKVVSATGYDTNNVDNQPVEELASRETSTESPESNSTDTIKVDKATSPFAAPTSIETITESPKVMDTSGSAKPVFTASPSAPPPPPATVIDRAIPQVAKASPSAKRVTPPQPIPLSAAAVPEATASTSKLPVTQTQKPQPERAEISTPPPAPATSSPAPLHGTAQKFQPLVDVLRRESHQFPHGVKRGPLSESLIKQNPQVYNLANVAKFRSYISAAVKAGIAVETRGGKAVALTSEYA